MPPTCCTACCTVIGVDGREARVYTLTAVRRAAAAARGGGGNKLTAKQRRQLKKGKLVVGEDGALVATEPSLEADAADEDAAVADAAAAERARRVRGGPSDL